MIVDALPVFCADKNYRYINDIICTGTKLLEAAFLPTYPDTTQWSCTYHVNIDIVEPTATVNAQTSVRLVTSTMVEKTHIFGTSPQKQLLTK